jgi:stage IV sporulation protein FB
MIRRLRQGLARIGLADQGPIFPVLGFAVRIHPTFWIGAFVLGLRGATGLLDMAGWVLVVLVSVLAHELGHALVAARWGVVYRITLHGAGGETHWRALGEDNWRRRVLVSLAGPSGGFVLAGLAWLVLPIVVRQPALFPVYRLVWDLLMVNLLWGVFNLLPLPPLDGGHILEAVLDRFAWAWSKWLAPLIGAITAAGAIVWAISAEQAWTILLLGFYGFQCAATFKRRLDEMRDARRRTGWHVDRAYDRERERYRG